jgi:cysteine-rich repeat protein
MTRYAPIALMLSAIVMDVAGCQSGAQNSDDQNGGDDLFAVRRWIWPTHSIPVCWLNANAGNAAGRAWTQSAIQDTWERFIPVTFTGWGPCGSASDPGVRILVSDSGVPSGPPNRAPGQPYSAIGTSANLWRGSPSMYLDFTFGTWGPVCQTELEFCIRAIAAHEFGHALGFDHEQNRPDSTCPRDTIGFGDLTLGAYDPNSIMNYCAAHWNNNGQLSRGDIAGARAIYGTVAWCGDGFVQAGEQCDDGNSDNRDNCTNVCTVARCGDGFVQAGEQCDDGNANNGDGCTNACRTARCGDRIVEVGVEQCDDGNSDNGDNCTNVCTVARCGDGNVHAGIEECDDGNRDDHDYCTNACKRATCGDGIDLAGVERCDDGNTNDHDACTNSCLPARCGDGVIFAGVELCDDGNKSDGDACTNACLPARCGDGLVFAGVEACDDGNRDDADDCTNACTFPRCGDGIVQAGEACDDGNNVGGDGCSASCQ